LRCAILRNGLRSTSAFPGSCPQLSLASRGNRGEAILEPFLGDNIRMSRPVWRETRGC
jgi:hypothetical protein